MLTMLLMRPGTDWLMLYCSASRTRSTLRKGEPAGYSGTTTPPCTMGRGAYGASVAGPGFGTARGAGSGGSAACGVLCALTLTAASAVHSSAAKADPSVFLCIVKDYITDARRDAAGFKRRLQARLRLKFQGSFSRGTVVEQFERLHALRLPTVLEENQAGYRKRAIAFRQEGFLHPLFHGAPLRERHLGRRGRRVVLTLTTTSAAAHAAFRFLLGRRLPLGIFKGPRHPPERLAWQGHLLAVDAQRKVIRAYLEPCPIRTEKSGLHH